MYDAVCVLSSAVRNRCVGVCTCTQRFSLTGLGLAPASALASGSGFWLRFRLRFQHLHQLRFSSCFCFCFCPGFCTGSSLAKLKFKLSVPGPCQTPAPGRFQLRVQSQSSMAQVVMRSPAYKERLRWGIRPGFYRSESAIFVRKWPDGRFYRSDGV